MFQKQPDKKSKKGGKNSGNNSRNNSRPNTPTVGADGDSSGSFYGWYFRV